MGSAWPAHLVASAVACCKRILHLPNFAICVVCVAQSMHNGVGIGLVNTGKGVAEGWKGRGKGSRRSPLSREGQKAGTAGRGIQCSAAARGA